MKIVEIAAAQGSADTVAAIAEQHGAASLPAAPPGEDGRQTLRVLVDADNAQPVLDALQGVFGSDPQARILLLPAEGILPRPAESSPEAAAAAREVATREELYNGVERGARLDANYLLLVVLSTVVAAVGLMEDNLAAVLGAMVIAPLLGPNLAFGLGTALGDRPLIAGAVRTNLAGLATAFACAAFIGWIWPANLHSQELMARADVGLDGIVLALASGAAAVLSLTTGLSTVLVGVMVAVALLPPAAALGLFAGGGHWRLAGGAALLLAVNVVCVNLAATLVFWVRGVKPRTWLEKRRARESLALSIALWAAILAVLVAVILLHPPAVR